MKIRLTNGRTQIVSGITETTLIDDQGNRTGAVSDSRGNLYLVTDRDAEGALWAKAKGD